MGHHHSKSVFSDIGHFITHDIPHVVIHDIPRVVTHDIPKAADDTAHWVEHAADTTGAHVIEGGVTVYHGGKYITRKVGQLGEKAGKGADDGVTTGLEDAGVSAADAGEVGAAVGTTAEVGTDVGVGAAVDMAVRPPTFHGHGARAAHAHTAHMETVSAQSYLNKRGEVNMSKRIGATMLVPAGQMLAAPPKAIQPKLKPRTITHHPDGRKAAAHSHPQTVQHKKTYISQQSKPNSIPDSYATHSTPKAGSHKLAPAPALAMN